MCESEQNVYSGFYSRRARYGHYHHYCFYLLSNHQLVALLRFACEQLMLSAHWLQLQLSASPEAVVLKQQSISPYIRLACNVQTCRQGLIIGIHFLCLLFPFFNYADVITLLKFSFRNAVRCGYTQLQYTHVKKMQLVSNKVKSVFKIYLFVCFKRMRTLKCSYDVMPMPSLQSNINTMLF